MELKI
jgi:hypothetical protein